MITVISGSQEITDMRHLEDAIRLAQYEITAVISGCARGVDALAIEWAARNNLPLIPFPVSNEEWKRVGNSAGIRRNVRMVDNAEALIAVWDGRSPGTRHAIGYAKQKGLLVYVHRVPEEPHG